MATEAIRTIHTAVLGKYPNIVFGGPGVVVCRPIKHTSHPQWSQHAYGNGQDYGGTPQELASLYRFLLRNRGRLPIGTVCYDGKGGCTTGHRTHLHVDGLPRMTGTPQCAGGRPTTAISATPRSSDNPVLGAVAKASDIAIPGSGLLIRSIFGDTTSPLTTLSDAVRAIFEPVTWIRAGLFVGGSTLMLMGLSALVGGTVVSAAALAGGPIGTAAKIGATIGGK